jgi:hypothetical protein
MIIDPLIVEASLGSLWHSDSGSVCAFCQRAPDKKEKGLPAMARPRFQRQIQGSPTYRIVRFSEFLFDNRTSAG